MAKTTTSIRFDENTKKLVQQYPISQRGVSDFTWRVTEIIHTVNDMLKHTKRELAGLFTKSEAMLIVDVCNAYLYHSSGSPKAALLLEVGDGIAIERLDEKWKIDNKALIEKIKGLTEYQAYTVLTMAFEFWSLDKPTDKDAERIFLVR